MVCDASCGFSLQTWYDSVATNCAGYNVSRSAATKYGGQIWSGYNETCLKVSMTGQYCNNVIEGFNEVTFTRDLPRTDLCSECFVERLRMMQRSPYSLYDESFKNDLQVVYSSCKISGPLEKAPSLDAPPEFLPDPICVSGKTHTTVAGDTCDLIAVQYNVSSTALFMTNSRQAMTCNKLSAGMNLCLPESCVSVYTLSDVDTCMSIETENSYPQSTVRKYNSWVDWDCSNLQKTTQAYGHVLCIGVQGGTYTATSPVPGVTVAPGGSNGYSNALVDPPSDAIVADGTTLRCGRWHVATEGETCTTICLQESVTSGIFLDVNPSLSSSACDKLLVVGYAYCVAPNGNWENYISSPTPVLPAVSPTATPST